MEMIPRLTRHPFLPFQVNLAQFLYKEGRQLLYSYDLGDHFEHRITVEEIRPQEDSTGAVQVRKRGLVVQGKWRLFQTGRHAY